MQKKIFFLICIFLTAHISFSQNYDESKVGNYTLPDPLTSLNKKKIKYVKKWEHSQRNYILQLFEENVYGKIPAAPHGMHYCLTEIDSTALNNTAIRKQITVFFHEGDKAPFMNLLIYLPKATKPVPVFVSLNFRGNHTIATDENIHPSRYLIKTNPSQPDSVAIKSTRGLQASRWPLQEIINSGFGVATVHYYDLEPDYKEGWKSGVRSTMKNILHIHPDAWGAISAWAWGLLRIQDYLETDNAVDATKTIVIGHSRLGKAALWAGANDKRFSMVISNNSGEGGAALARRNFGETIQIITTAFPHWFVKKYATYGNDVNKMPVDQHMLLALTAPRPLYVASAEDDKWADPKGEFLAAKYAEPIYKLYGLKGLQADAMPDVNMPVGENIGYHMRNGKHDITLYDWEQYIQFAQKHYRK